MSRVATAASLSTVFLALLLLALHARLNNLLLSTTLAKQLRLFVFHALRDARAQQHALLKPALGISSLTSVLLLIRYRKAIGAGIVVVGRHVGGTMSSAATRGSSAVGALVSSTGHIRSTVTERSGELLSAAASSVSSASGMVRSTIERVYEARLDSIERRLEGYVAVATGYAGDALKYTIKDPFMPSVLKDLLDESVDKLIPDIRHAATNVATEVPLAA